MQGCRGAWPSPPALEAGDRWFESTRPDQFEIRRDRGGRAHVPARTLVRGRPRHAPLETSKARCRTGRALAAPALKGHGYFGFSSRVRRPATVSAFLPGAASGVDAGERGYFFLGNEDGLRPSHRSRCLLGSACGRRDAPRLVMTFHQPVVMAGLALKSTVTSPSKRVVVGSNPTRQTNLPVAQRIEHLRAVLASCQVPP